MSLLGEGLSALRQIEEMWFGEVISYLPLGGHEIELRAVPGKSLFRETNEYGAFVQTETRDFIVRKEELPITPQKGDEIVFGARHYEVLSPTGEPCWRWTDPLETAKRIHTKYIGGGEHE